MIPQQQMQNHFRGALLGDPLASVKESHTM